MTVAKFSVFTDVLLYRVVAAVHTLVARIDQLSTEGEEIGTAGDWGAGRSDDATWVQERGSDLVRVDGVFPPVRRMMTP